MNTKLLLFALFMLSGTFHSQTPDVYRSSYRITFGNDKDSIRFYSKKEKKTLSSSVILRRKTDETISQKDSTDNLSTSQPLTSEVLQKNSFSKTKNLKSSIKLKEDTLQYYIWKYRKSDDPLTRIKNKFIDKNNIYRTIEKGYSISIKSRLYYIGAMTTPLKWYLGEKGDTLSDSRIKFNANVGLAFGYKRQWNRVSNLWGEDTLKVTKITGLSHNLIFGINQTEFNSENNTNFTGDKKRAAPAVSLAYGFAYHINSFYVIATGGFDIPLSHYNKGWKYQGIPWIGFGIGLGLESIGIGGLANTN